MARTTTRVPMPQRMRAKQFAMFDAMKGLTEAIAKKERQVISQKELTEQRIEEISNVLASIGRGDVVTVIYYCQYEEKYHRLTGQVNNIDPFWKELLIGNTSIHFSEIYEIAFDSTTPQANACGE